MDDITPQEDIEHNTIFASSICRSHHPEYLDSVREIFNKHTSIAKKERPIYDLYPVCMTANLTEDLSKEFITYVVETAWTVLERQGYNMPMFETQIMDMWGQEHHRGSGMEQHMHNSGAQISGIYIIDAPEQCRMLFHDPREAKNYANLPEINSSNLTFASPVAAFDLNPGNFIFHNSWLYHSFPKNSSYDPLKFIHFNIAVKWVGNTSTCIQPEAPTII